MSSHPESHAEAPKSAGTEHVGRAKDPAIVRRSQKPVNFIKAIPQWIALAIAFFMIVSWMKSCGDEPEVVGQASQQQQSQSYVPQVVVEEARSMRVFDIPPEGLRVYLRSGWQDFPLHGAITIETPDGTILTDEPGVPHDFGFQPDGMYTFRSKPVGEKRGVRIYNFWRREHSID